MKNLFIKEIKLASSPLSFLFILFSLMVFIPNYPILVGAFFINFGIFHSFQNSRETNDILYTALLPVRKVDVVRAKYLFVCFIQMVAFALIIVFSFLRIFVLKDVSPYSENALMNPNLVLWGFALVIFTCFNVFFVNGFFKTSYRFGKPFILFGITTFIVISIAEALHFFPNLSYLNDMTIEAMPRHLPFLCGGIAIYVGGTLLAYRSSQTRFGKQDL